MPRNLFIRPVKLSDVGRIMTWVNDPEVVKNLQHFNKRFTKHEEIAYIKRMRASRNDFVFSIFRESDGVYIGQGGIHQISWENKLGRLSLLIKKEYWGRGYAQGAIPLLLDYAFRKLKLHKIWLMAWATNKKALHIYKKLGFKKEGVLKDEYFWRRKYHDMVRFGIINHAFKK